MNAYNPHRSTARVLIIEPLPIMSLGLSCVCKRQGFAHIDQARDGYAALELLRKQSYNVIVLALNLPDRMRVALAAQRNGPTWMIGVGHQHGPFGGVDVVVSPEDPIEIMLEALDSGFPAATLRDLTG
jgi:DNA-binding NarL/FixJ family response regulator